MAAAVTTDRCTETTKGRAALYRSAAEAISGGERCGCCNIFCRVLPVGHSGDECEKFLHAFCDVFEPETHGSYWWDEPPADSLERAVALDLMAAMVEAGDVDFE
jgi:hypothetical protein